MRKESRQIALEFLESWENSDKSRMMVRHVVSTGRVLNSSSYIADGTYQPTLDLWIDIFDHVPAIRDQLLTARTVFIEDAQNIEAYGMLGKAIDLIRCYVIAHLKAGKFELLDSAFNEINVGQISTDLIYALLIATLPAKTKLPSRPNFWDRANTTLKHRREYVFGMFDHLK